MTPDLVAFLGIAVLVIVTPGQDTALTIRNTLAGGRRCGLFTSLGVSSGQAFWTLAASAGLAALLVASKPVFTAVRLAGAAYLVWLGVQALFAALRRGRHAPGLPRAHAAPKPSAAYRQGLLSNLGNPKMAVFFTSLLPQFTARGSLLAPLVLGLVFCLMTLAWLTCYAVAVAKAGEVLRRPAVRRALDAVTGTVLVAFGIRLAIERR